MANTTQRTPRELETREQAVREEVYAPPQLLPEITEREGWEHRWIRVSIMGETDKMNTSVRFREGWEPVKASEYPEVQMTSEGKFKDMVEVGGLILCRAPKEKIEARKKYYQNSAQSQLDSVDNNFMKENDPRMPLFSERKSKVSFGNGK